MPPADCVVAVHCGAGYHAPRLEQDYKSAMEAACRTAAATIGAGGSVLYAAAAATAVLEDSPVTNAGLGSNLTEEGAIECDASVMDGRKAFGAVGACPGVANPVLVAKRIAEESTVPMPLGRVRPIFIAGDNARRWALKRCLKAAATPQEALEWGITARAKLQWEKYMAMLAKAAPAWHLAEDSDPAQPPRKRPRVGIEVGSQGAIQGPQQAAEPQAACPALAGDLEPGFSDHSLVYDTVGCFCISAAGECAAAVSSGGLAVKVPGRIGEAAVYGSGCWAENGAEAGGCHVVCSITGVGENIMRSGLARKIGDQLKTASNDLPSEVCAAAIRDLITESASQAVSTPTDCGIIAARVSRDEGRLVVDFGAAHSSSSLAYGLWGPGLDAPITVIDRAAQPELAKTAVREIGRRLYLEAVKNPANGP